MKTPIKVALAGLGSRGLKAYGYELYKLKEFAAVTAIADIDVEKVSLAQKIFSLDDSCCFSSAEELLSQPKLADVIFISTQDRQHVSQAVPALRLGYQVVLEKPISPELPEIQELVRTQKQTGNQVIVCHVLRYTQFYNTLKNLIDDQVIGDVMNIQAIENVGYWHQAHSFVRGNWRNSKETSPMILQKCCHDFDIFLWLTTKKPKRVSSFGSLSHFKLENAPEGAAKYCLDSCRAKDTCVFDAEKIYLSNPATGFLHGHKNWPLDVLSIKPTKESLINNLKTGAYGRCVYYCDNDVVDHQVVNIELDDSVFISFTMSAFSKDCFRRLQIMGTAGNIIADTKTNRINVLPFAKDEYTIDINKTSSSSGHGGGDSGLVREVIDYFRVTDNSRSSRLSYLDVSIDSHLIALAAESSRLENGKLIDIHALG